MLIDDWIDRVTCSQDEHYATFFFMLHRLPAFQKMMWAPWIKEHRLYCTWKGRLYRVTGCSRLGDVWLSRCFNQDTGYDERVSVEECSGWRAKP